MKTDYLLEMHDKAMRAKRLREVSRVMVASRYLRADLVWSDDFDAVRDRLADLLEQISHLPKETQDKLQPALNNLIFDLMGD